MGKALKLRLLNVQSASRGLLAISLVAALATFGCTTNRTLGDGDPTSAGAGVRTPPTGGVTTGEEGPSFPPPMTSSYDRTELRDVWYVRADQAAAYMARVEGIPQVRVLGPSNPGSAPVPSASAAQVTGQFVNPAVIANPQLTVNSSASSLPVPVITSGAGEAGGIAAGVIAEGPGFVAGVVDPGAGVPTAAPLFVPSGVPATPTTAAIPLAPGAFAGPEVMSAAPSAAPAGTLLPPTMISGAVPPVTAVSGGVMAPGTGLGSVAQPIRIGAARRSSTTAGVTAAASAGAVRVVTATSGRVVVTNVD